MKLASYVKSDGTPGCGIVTDGDAPGVIDLGGRPGGASSLRALLARDGWQGSLEPLAGAAPDFPLAGLTFLPVIPDPDKILCVGINYASHVAETGRETPVKPMIFTRFANSQAGHGQPMIRPAASERFDFEGELAVVIGAPARNVAPEDAAACIAGFSCYNDGSIRDWQRHTTQFAPGKNFPATGAFGPWLVTPDEFGEVASRRLVTRLNGEVMQSAGFDDLIFDVPTLISYCSHFTRLEPGDVIITGTTGGVGAFRTPPVWMAPGDEVEVEISGIGVLRNTVVDESPERPVSAIWR